MPLIKGTELAKITRYKQAIYQTGKTARFPILGLSSLRKRIRTAGRGLDEILESPAEQAELENGIDIENPFLTVFRQYQNIDKLPRTF